MKRYTLLRDVLRYKPYAPRPRSSRRLGTDEAPRPLDVNLQINCRECCAFERRSRQRITTYQCRPARCVGAPLHQFCVRIYQVSQALVRSLKLTVIMSLDLAASWAGPLDWTLHVTLLAAVRNCQTTRSYRPTPC
ncbi:hypothetical protein CLIM01_11868 [Colletotrichum limetticola]|uniref:Uncharacterized protein n=1 Tax=Colletotrichum limetticola TaxID=1209924 RepID=A0ABQ9PFE5_9PEZI|nr:hypothetical protein CLIM01_11868 [Colletotrichum limetticola]